MDLITTVQTLAPVKVGMGIGIFALVYGTAKMELRFGLLGFFLCFFAGVVAQLFV